MCGRRAVVDIIVVVVASSDADEAARARIDEGAAMTTRRIINRFIIEARKK
jgi:hypothetical protein